MQAKISVCIPAYHNPQGLGRLLQSLRCQSYRDFEVIVTDDSDDESISEICGQFADLPGIRYIRNRQRLGAPRNWNEAVSMACGEWIMVMHHDDWLSTNHSLSSFAKTADKIGSGWIFSSCDAYKRGLVKGFTHRPFGPIGRYLSTDEISGWPLLFENKIGCPSVLLVHRSLSMDYDEKLLWFVDVDMYIRLLRECQPYYIPDLLVNATYGSEEQITYQASRDIDLALRELMYLYEKHHLAGMPECRQRLRQRVNNVDAAHLRQMLFQNILPCSTYTRTRVALDILRHIKERDSSLLVDAKKVMVAPKIKTLSAIRFMHSFVDKTRTSMKRLLGLHPNQSTQAASSEAGQPHDVRPYLRFPDSLEAAANANNDMERIFYSHQGRPSAKWHHYLEVYDRHLARFRGKQVRLLEIGVQHGGSLQIWRQYFGPQAIIFGIDIDEKCRDFDDEDGRVRIGSQADPEFLQEVVKEMGGIDIVIDDGSHVASHQRISFDCLYPLLNNNGVYLCEDLQAAYWPVFHDGGYKREGTFIEVVKELIDDIHSWYHDQGSTVLDTAAESIHSLCVYEGIVAVEKRSRPRSFFTLMPPPEDR
jgi:hypothetical protein